MKTVAIYLVLSFWAVVTNAQQVTVLDEAVVGFAPVSSEVTSDGDTYSFRIHESFQGEFEADPLGFMDEYFNIANFISEVKRQGFDSYEVTLRSKNGSLRAVFDKEGNLEKSSHRFKDVVLPEDLRHQLYKDHKGWAMVKNVHIAKGKNGELTKNFYKIKLENGSETKRIKIDADLSGAATEIASN